MKRRTSPHEANHGVQVCDGCLVPSEDLSPGTLFQREPGTELLHKLIAAAGVEDLWVVPAQGQVGAWREHQGGGKIDSFSLTSLN